MPDFETETYVIAFLRKGPVWTGVESPELSERQARHLDFLSGLRESGKALVSGPILDSPDNLRGITILKTSSVEEAQQWMAEDPHVRVGHLVVDFLTWMVRKGELGK
jgi:uncharacterized protein YciI